MKFPLHNELHSFLSKKNMFPDYINIEEIYTGGSSFNFRLHTKTGDYLLKLTQNKYNHMKLRVIYSLLYGIKQPEKYKFKQYYLLVMPYIDGVKLHYSYINQSFMQKLITTYRNFTQMELPQQYILPERNLQRMREDSRRISLYSATPFFIRLILRVLDHYMNNDLKSFSANKSIIHGDFSSNNIIVDQNKCPHIIDFEAVRYGSSVEDMAFLILQLSGFRGLMGNIKKFLLLKNMFSYTREEWFFGIQLFYLNRICNRYNYEFKNIKQRSFRKNLCFFISMYGYMRLRKYL